MQPTDTRVYICAGGFLGVKTRGGTEGRASICLLASPIPGKARGGSWRRSGRCSADARRADVPAHAYQMRATRAGPSRFEPGYWMALLTDEKTLLALLPIRRIVPTTITRITASITAYSAISWPSSSCHKLHTMLIMVAPSLFEPGLPSRANRSGGGFPGKDLKAGKAAELLGWVGFCAAEQCLSRDLNFVSASGEIAFGHG